MPDPQLTVLNLYTLKTTAADFEAAIRLLVARVQKEGHPGVRSYRFFVNAAHSTGRAVIDYETPEAWIGHHDLAMDWPEMKGLHAVAALSEVTFLGPLTPSILDWIATSSLTARLNQGNVFAAGFHR